MIRFRTVLTFFTAVLGVALLPTHAGATTINTYSFTQGGWHNGVFGPLVTDNGLLEGTFTGVVEPAGYIQLADLTAFSMQFTDDVVGSFVQLTYSFGDLQFFSFNARPDASDPDHGAASLDVIASHVFGPPALLLTTCVGAATTFSPSCYPGSFVPGAKAIVAGSIFWSTALPVVTLVSSVDIPDPITAVPEPGTLMLLGTGVISLIGANRRRTAGRF
jgi:hypothetical protein